MRRNGLGLALCVLRQAQDEGAFFVPLRLSLILSLSKDHASRRMAHLAALRTGPSNSC